MTAEDRANEYARHVQRGRWWIGLSAIVFAVSGLIELAASKGHASAPLNAAGADLGLAALFAVFWLWARRAPAAALASSMALLLGVWIVVGVIDRSTLLDGYVLRLAALVDVRRRPPRRIAARRLARRAAEVR